MKNCIKPLILALACSLTSVALADAPKPEQLIKWRQSAYQVINWNFARIKNSVEGQYNKEEVIKAANTIAAMANSGMGVLYAPGTEKGDGWHHTHAKPAIFKDGAKVGELAGNFKKEAEELAKVATTGDAAKVGEQLGKLGKTCKACHDDYRMKD